MLKDKRLSLRDRGLMVTLMSLTEEWEFSIRGVASILTDGKAAIQKSLKRLEELKYISRSQERDVSGKYTKNVLVINDNPESSPCTEIRSPVNPPAENQPQYKKNKKYKKIYISADKKQKVNNFNCFHQRTYDYKTLEREAAVFS